MQFSPKSTNNFLEALKQRVRNLPFLWLLNASHDRSRKPCIVTQRNLFKILSKSESSYNPYTEDEICQFDITTMLDIENKYNHKAAGRAP